MRCSWNFSHLLHIIPVHSFVFILYWLIIQVYLSSSLFIYQPCCTGPQAIKFARPLDFFRRFSLSCFYSIGESSPVFFAILCNFWSICWLLLYRLLIMPDHQYVKHSTLKTHLFRPKIDSFSFCSLLTFLPYISRIMLNKTGECLLGWFARRFHNKLLSNIFFSSIKDNLW